LLKAVQHLLHGLSYAVLSFVAVRFFHASRGKTDLSTLIYILTL